MTKVLVTAPAGLSALTWSRRCGPSGRDVTCLVRKTSAGPPWRRRASASSTATSPTGSRSAAVAGQEVVYHLAGCLRALNPRAVVPRQRRGGPQPGPDLRPSRPTPPVLVEVSSLAAAGPALSATSPVTKAIRPLPCRTMGGANWPASGPRGNSPRRSPSPSCGRRSSSARRIRPC